MPRSNRLNVGVVGLGYWGKNLVRTFAKLPNARLTALCDVDGEQVRLAGKRQTLEVIERADRIGIQPALAKQRAIVRRERQHHCAQVMPELFALKPADRLFRQLLPTALEQVPFHDVFVPRARAL